MRAFLLSPLLAYLLCYGQIQNQSDDGQWAMPAKDYASTRYSTLDQITTSNISNLKLVWTFSTGLTRGHEAAPLIVNNTMFLVTPWPNLLYALDLTQPGAPARWTYSPQPSRSSQGLACCDVVNRGASFFKGRVYFNTLDAQTVAVDASTGKAVWKTAVGNPKIGETMTMAPIVVKGKVLTGNSGGEMGVRGWLAALDAETGKILWRAYSTGPDRDVLIGPSFKPFYDQDRAPDLGVKTWQGEQWKIGGGAGWGWISYDPELDLIYYGTSNPAPWNADQRPGDNKWTATLFARRPDTGEAIWAYQISPHDDHDYDAVNENILIDITIGGRLRKVLVHPDRNARMYVMDRATGEVLSAEPFAHQNTSESVDLKSGRIRTAPAKSTGYKTVRDICPAAPGAKDWQPSAYRPRPAGCIFPTTICVWRCKGCRRITSRAHLTWGPMSGCMQDRGAIAESSLHGTRQMREPYGRCRRCFRHGAAPWSQQVMWSFTARWMDGSRH
jgi:alcohol dehydrogenase (cytochrome c)